MTRPGRCKYLRNYLSAIMLAGGEFEFSELLVHYFSNLVLKNMQLQIVFDGIFKIA